jgi:hypothetical protein
MNKSELKQLIKPIVEECVQQSVKQLLLDSGLLASVINEVVKGTLPLLVEKSNTPSRQQVSTTSTAQIQKPRNNELLEQMKRDREELKNEIKQQSAAVSNNLSFKVGGVDVFKGTTPAPAPIVESIADPLGGVSPNDPGVDISRLFGGKKFNIRG